MTQDKPALERTSPASGVQPLRIDALHLRQVVGSRDEKVLLDDISVTALPGDFVAFVGGSGAGKSTLLDALNGFRPASDGHVLVNGADYYANISDYKQRLGYVPQDDIIHRELTVEDAVYFAARLRLPSDTPLDEVRARVDEALEEVEMAGQRRQQISKLSGGQRKRVSIATELISRPGLLYLDEPTSGLDPVLERRFMLLLRRLADEGRTVVMVTHATANIDMCDKVGFLGRGGKLCFYGSPDDALEFFGASRITDIYDLLDASSDSPALWEQQFRASEYQQRYVREPQKSVAVDGFPAYTVMPSQIDEGPDECIAGIPDETAASTSIGGFRQFAILTQRYAKLLWTDKLTLGILVSQAPFMGFSLMLVIGDDLYADGKSFISAQLALAMIAILAIWIGTNSSAREIVKEDSVYRRERLVNLGVVPYVGSKIAVLGVLTIIQAALLLSVISIKTGTPPNGVFFPGWLELMLGLTLSMLAAMALGLLVSAMSGNVAIAAAAAPLLVAPQMLLGGFILPVDGAAEGLSYTMVGRWSSAAMGTTAELNRLYYQTVDDGGGGPTDDPVLEQVNFDPDFYDTDPGPKSAEQSREDRRPLLLRYWAILAGMTSLFLAGTLFFQWRKDSGRRR